MDIDLAQNVDTTLQMWEIVTGFFLPLLISVVVQSKWSQRAQSVAMFLVSAGVTCIQLLIRGELDNFVDPATSIMTVLVFTISTYKGLWKPLGVSPAIEDATSPGTT